MKGELGAVFLFYLKKPCQILPDAEFAAHYGRVSLATNATTKKPIDI